MEPLESPLSNSSSKKLTDFSMNGRTQAEWKKGRISGPLSDKELFAYLKKIGKLPADAEYKRAS